MPRSTNRNGERPVIRVFAFDHRLQFEAMADEAGVDRARIGTFKTLCLRAAKRVAGGGDGFGILCDSRLGSEALYDAAGSGLWIGRPVEWPGSRPLALEPEIGEDFGGLIEWPLEHVVKVLCFYHPDDTAEMKAAQEETVKRLFASARSNRLEILLEIIPSKVGPVNATTTAAIIERFYEIGVFPDWWKLEPMKSDAAWASACAAVERHDPFARGIVVLGLDAAAEELATSFASAARHELVRGFAVGRTIFGEAAQAWLGGKITDDEAVAAMASKYRALCDLWDNARSAGRTAE
jgi:5-dehydro-2-deoxygluconokinase